MLRIIIFQRKVALGRMLRVVFNESGPTLSKERLVAAAKEIVDFTNNL